MPGQPPWSWDGTQLAWTTSTRVDVANKTTGAVRTWDCDACTGIAFLGDRAVTAAQSAAGGQTPSATPRLAEYPAAGLGDPSNLILTGITTAGPDRDFSVLSTISPQAIVVAYGSAPRACLRGCCRSTRRARCRRSSSRGRWRRRSAWS